MTETVRVELGARAYDVRIGEGLIADAAAEIAPLPARRGRDVPAGASRRACSGSACSSPVAVSAALLRFVALPPAFMGGVQAMLGAAAKASGMPAFASALFSEQDVTPAMVAGGGAPALPSVGAAGPGLSSRRHGAYP